MGEIGKEQKSFLYLASANGKWRENNGRKKTFSSHSSADIEVKKKLERQEDGEDSLHCSSSCITKQLSDDLEMEALLNFQTFLSLSVKNDPNTSKLR